MTHTGTIPILEKAIALLGVVAESEDASTVKKLSLSTKTPIATCYRIVRTFVKHHWLQEKGKGEFQLGFGIAHLARSYAELERLLTVIDPILKDVAARTRLSVKITMRENRNAITVLRAEPPRPDAITSPVGFTYPLALGGSAGIMLLTQLSDDEVTELLDNAPAEAWRHQTPQEIRQRIVQAGAEGICWELGKLNPSLHAISINVTLAKSFQSVLSFVGWPDDFEESRKAGIERQLRDTARRISKVLESAAR